MNEIIRFSNEELMPERGAVLANQGIPAGKALPPEIETLYEKALGLLPGVATPVGVWREIATSDFAAVYEGEGENEPRTPVGDIFGRAENLALFAVTLGQRISQEVNERFRSNDFALGTMLDAAASAAADKLAEVIESRFLASLSRSSRATAATGVLAYSPGYCGWHISGQRKLFEFLNPEQIGITLTDSFLMQPLKSVSGVLIAGPKEIHFFRNSYPFCDRCDAHGCLARMAGLRTR
jgi:hypothetical protein